MSSSPSVGVALQTYELPEKPQLAFRLPKLGFGPGPLSDGALASLLGSWLVVGILLQKLCILVAPTTGVQIPVVWLYILLPYLVYRGNILISVTRMILLMLFFIAALTVSFFNNPIPTSLFYVFGLYIPFMLIVKMDRPNYMRVLDIFQLFALFASIWVFMDWAFQVAGLPMPNAEHIIPKKIQFFQFNYIQPLNWNSKWYKPNAFFFLEVSYVSQVIASALIFELCIFRRFRYVIVLALGQVCSFGGTGWVLILLSLPMIIAKLRLKMFAAALIVIPIAFYTASQVGLVENVMLRSQEFNRKGSSADQRFAGQVEEVVRNVTKSPSAVFVGIGAGNTLQDGRVVWNPVVKVTSEYGLVVSFFFFSLLIVSMFSNRIPFTVGYVNTVQFLLLNGGFLVPVNPFILLMLSTFISIRPESKELSVKPH